MTAPPPELQKRVSDYTMWQMFLQLCFPEFGVRKEWIFRLAAELIEQSLCSDLWSYPASSFSHALFHSAANGKDEVEIHDAWASWSAWPVLVG